MLRIVIAECIQNTLHYYVSLFNSLGKRLSTLLMENESNTPKVRPAGNCILYTGKLPVPFYHSAKHHAIQTVTYSCRVAS